MKFDSVTEAALFDLAIFGTAVIKVFDDGTRRHIPLQDLYKEGPYIVAVEKVWPTQINKKGKEVADE